jgi:MFS family permease
MWLDIRPLKNNRDFRYVFFGQFVSFFGTMLSFVALPFQIYELTHSTAAVGLMGVVELVPLLVTAFIGGSLADIIDRKKLLVYAEMGLAGLCLLLVINALLPHPHLWVIYVIAGLSSALNGLHRPALDAIVPRLVSHEEIQATSVLGTLKFSIGMIGGPAVAGICIAKFGIAWTYVLDFATFLVSLLALMQIKSVLPLEPAEDKPSLKGVVESFRYAVSRQELLGTYVVDFVAIVFAMPNALFPALALYFGKTEAIGWLYAAPAVGALLISITSGWVHKVKRHGAAVVVAAFTWGLAIAVCGLNHSLIGVLIFLCLAGAADAVSGIFRVTIWNETIPDNIRGRMASLQVVSYMSGPLLGNAVVGFMASLTGLHMAIMIGGTLCMVGVILCLVMLPRFWQYRKAELPVT